MDKDRVAGSAKHVKGTIKELVGKAIGEAHLFERPALWADQNAVSRAARHIEWMVLNRGVGLYVN